MAYSSVPTVVTGDTWTAANHNTYLKNNMATLWPYTGSEDIAVASGPTTLKRLAVGNNYNILAVIAGILTYKPLSDLIQFQTSSQISTDTQSTSYIDVPNSTISMTLNTTSQLLIWLVATATAQSAESLHYHLMAGSSYGDAAIEFFTADLSRQTIQFLYVPTYPAGAVTIKAQFFSVGGVRVNLYNGKMYCLAIPRS
jgi:hypothetical protein